MKPSIWFLSVICRDDDTDDIVPAIVYSADPKKLVAKVVEYANNKLDHLQDDMPEVFAKLNECDDLDIATDLLYELSESRNIDLIIQYGEIELLEDKGNEND